MNPEDTLYCPSCGCDVLEDGISGKPSVKSTGLVAIEFDCPECDEPLEISVDESQQYES